MAERGRKQGFMPDSNRLSEGYSPQGPVDKGDPLGYQTGNGIR